MVSKLRMAYIKCIDLFLYVWLEPCFNFTLMYPSLTWEFYICAYFGDGGGRAQT